MMSEWNLFMPGEPDTRPPLNKPLVVCDFKGILRKPTPVELVEKKGELQWAGGYIGPATKPMMWFGLPDMPVDPRIYEMEKCGDETRSCPYEDDGRCFDPPVDFVCDKVVKGHYLYDRG